MVPDRSNLISASSVSGRICGTVVCNTKYGTYRVPYSTSAITVKRVDGATYKKI